MNYRIDPETLPFPGRVTQPSRQVRPDRRQRVVNEVMAGFLWMSLDPPDDTNLDEIKQLALDLAQRIRAGGNESEIAAQLEYVQRHQLCRPVDPARLKGIARRAVAFLTDA
jgi:hypothetical protein